MFPPGLKAEPDDAEVNAEIARLYAEKSDRRFAECFDRALRHCRGIDIEDSVIYTAIEAAEVAGDQERQTKAIRIGRRRFPDCSLFT